MQIQRHFTWSMQFPFLGNRGPLLFQEKLACILSVIPMMIKIASGNNENASVELTEPAVGKGCSAEERNNDDLYEKNNDFPLLCSNDGDGLPSLEVKARKSVIEKEEQARKSCEKIDWSPLGIEDECQDTNGNTRLRIDMEDGQPKAGEMDLPGGRILCGQHGGKRYNHHLCLENVIHEDATMHQKSAPSAVSKDLIETYCRTLEELEKCRGKINKLTQDNAVLVEKLKEFDWDRECHRKEMQAEKQFRERIQNDLRKIVKEMECHQPETLTVRNATASLSTDIDIEYFKDQLKVYQEDFKQEKAEKMKLRELNSLLTTELEEAKQTIESQQKKLLVYAQIFSNGSGAQVVIPPAYIGRRVRSNPSSPSYTHLYPGSRHSKQFSELHDENDQKQRSIAYDPIYDVVPKGSIEKPDKTKQAIERRTSVP